MSVAIYNEEQVYLAEVCFPFISESRVKFKDGSIIAEEMFNLDGKTIEVRKTDEWSKYDYLDGTWNYKKEWLKNMRPKLKKEKVPLDKGTIELGDWIRWSDIIEMVIRKFREELETKNWLLDPNKIYTENSYSKDRGKTWLPMYKEVEVEE